MKRLRRLASNIFDFAASHPEVPADKAVDANEEYYGIDSSGNVKYLGSDLKHYINEGVITNYTTQDFDNAIKELEGMETFIKAVYNPGTVEVKSSLSGKEVYELCNTIHQNDSTKMSLWVVEYLYEEYVAG